MRNRFSRLLVPAVLAVLVAALGAAAASAGSGTPPTATDTPQFEGTAKSETVGGVDPSFLTNARTIAHWTFNYTDPQNGVTYPITMVGADPKTNASSTIHTIVVPLRLNIVAGNQNTSSLDDLGFAGFRATPLTHSFDGTRRVANVLGSPVFKDAKYDRDLGGDTGQVGDVFMRSQFAKIGSKYHVKLVNDSVAPTQVIDVPANKGLAYQRPVGAWRTAQGLPTETIAGVVDDGWFSGKLQNLLGSLHVPGDVVPIFL